MERYFIGQLLTQTHIINKTILEPEDFENAECSIIFKTMRELASDNKNINELTISRACGIEIETLLEYTKKSVIASSWQSYEEQVKEGAMSRKIKNVCEVIASSSQPSSDLVDMFIEETESVRTREIFQPVTLAECVKESMEAFEIRAQSKGLPGIPTGFEIINDICGGFRPARLVYVGARPSHGKSTLLMNFAVNSQVPCVFFTAESRREEFTDRVLIRKARINAKQFSHGEITERDAKSLVDTAGEYSKNNDMIVYEETNMPIMKLINVAYDMARKGKIKAIFIDYIQILTPPDKGIPRHEQVANMSMRLKQLANNTGLPVICASQLTRDSDGNKPQLKDFSDSTQLERDCDIGIMIWNRPDENKIVDVGHETYLCIAKNRDGQLKDMYVKYEPQFYNFEHTNELSPMKKVHEQKKQKVSYSDQAEKIIF